MNPESPSNRPYDSSVSGDGYAEFETFALSITRRLFELKASDAVLFRLMAAYGAYVHKDAGNLGSFSEWDEVRLNFERIVPEHMAVLDREYTHNTIIAAITLFDTFLTDLTRFLFLLRPDSLVLNSRFLTDDFQVGLERKRILNTGNEP